MIEWFGLPWIFWVLLVIDVTIIFAGIVALFITWGLWSNEEYMRILDSRE